MIHWWLKIGYERSLENVFFNQMPQQLPPVIGLKKKSAIIKGFECKTYFGAKSDFFNQIVF